MRKDHITLKVWERGAGLTRACGTAACATIAAAARLRLTDRKATVTLPGGDLAIEWRESDDHILMTGPIAYEFEGALPAHLTVRGPMSEARKSSPSAAGSMPMSRKSCAARLAKAGLKNAIIFNTCAVTAEATRQARQAIRQARRDNPDARIIVTGCAAQTDPRMFCRHAGSRSRAWQ